MWFDYDGDDANEEYYTEVQPWMGDRTEFIAPMISSPPQNRAVATTSPLNNIEEEEEEDLYDADEEEDVASTEPGNFWINPLASTTSPPPRKINTRRTATSSRKTPLRSGSKPPPPMTDFYNRLFWYGLDPVDESDDGIYEDSDKRTMFGGTKGKFNGLSFLSDAVGVVPPEQQRPYRRRKRSDSGEELWSDADDLPSDRGLYRRDDTQRRNVPVTPPYDPPLMSTMNLEEGATTTTSSRRKRRNGQPRTEFYTNDDVEERRYNSFNEEEEDIAEENYDRRVRDDRRRSSSTRGRRGDWVSNTVSAWFEEDGNGAPSQRPRNPPSRRPIRDDESNGFPPVLQSFTGALETFLGMDRERQQQQAEEYNERMGFPNRKRRRRSNSSAAASFEPILERRPTPERSTTNRSRRTTRVSPPSVPPDGVLDAEPIEDLALDSDAAATMEPPSAATKMKPLTWEERALAIERVPPEGIPAWGPEGEIPNMDARTKALQDAIVDVKLMQNKIKEYEQSILDLQDEMSILKIDMELERREMHRQQQPTARNERRSKSTNQRLLEHIRSMELEFESMNRKLRYLQLRKSRVEQDSMDLNRRHWALFHCMKQIVVQDSLSKQMEDILREFNEAEPAAARLYAKVGDTAVPSAPEGSMEAMDGVARSVASSEFGTAPDPG